MPTIQKTSKRAQHLLDNAKNIVSYSLSGCFQPKPLVERPAIWADIYGKRDLINVSHSEFLRHELESRSTKLRENGPGKYCIDVHSNLWYEFEVAQ